MSRDRFLPRCLRFDSLDTRAERIQFHELAPIQTLFDSFIENCKEAYTVGPYTTIDEKLESFRGRCSFKQYNPSKPNPYGEKMFVLVDSATSYAADLEVHVGQQPHGPYENSNSPCNTVLRLTSIRHEQKSYV